MLRLDTIGAWLVFCSLCAPAHANGPFGIAMGAPIQQMSGCSAAPNAPTVYYCKSVPKSHPDIEIYAVVATPDAGVCEIRAIGKTLQGDAFGSNLRNSIDDFVSQLTPKYGQSKKTDYLRTGSIWRDQRDWMMSLKQNERIYHFEWEASASRLLPDNVKEIAVAARANDSSSGYVRIDFIFKNELMCKNEAQKQKGGVF